MAYAYIENNEIVEVHFLLPRSWRNISNFDSLTPTDLNNLNWYELVDVVPEYDAEMFEVYDTQLIYENGTPKRVFLLRDKVVPVVEEEVPAVEETILTTEESTATSNTVPDEQILNGEPITNSDAIP